MLSSLRLVFVGGSASPRPLIEAYDDLGIDYLQVWGMTETGPLACASRPRRRHRGLDRDALLDVREKTGTILPGVEARVVADDGAVLPLDGTTVGELEVRGPWIASAYYRDEGRRPLPRRLAAHRRHGVDGARRLLPHRRPRQGPREVGRRVDLLGRARGAPARATPTSPTPRWSACRRSDGTSDRSRWWCPPTARAPSLESVREFLAPKVAKWWLPDLVVPVDEIPKTSVGKLDKKALRAQLGGVELP